MHEILEFKPFILDLPTSNFKQANVSMQIQVKFTVDFLSNLSESGLGLGEVFDEWLGQKRMRLEFDLNVWQLVVLFF